MSVIWITGGKGFIGRNLAKTVATDGHRVHGIGHGLWPREEVASWSYSSWSNAEISAPNLSQLASESGPPGAIFHLAGGSSVGLSLQNPQEDFERTVVTTSRLLDWVRLNASNAKVIVASSAAVYGGGYVDAIAETAALSPYSPYGSHKAMVESLGRQYSEYFGLTCAIVRLFSVYGPGLEKQLIWDLCTKLAASNGEPIVLGGTGLEVRDWLHVHDATQVLKVAMENACATFEIVNGGTGSGTNISTIAKLVVDAWGTPTEIRFDGRARRGDPHSLVANVALAKRRGFKPNMNLQLGISDTVNWFKRRRHSSSSV